jgi:hypothetical protein
MNSRITVGVVVLLVAIALRAQAQDRPYPVLKPSCKAADYPPREKDWRLLIARAAPPWTYHVTTSEAAEPFLGTVLFEALPAEFAKTPGVVRVQQEDREVYLIETKGLTSTKLKAALWGTFVSVAAKACGRR